RGPGSRAGAESFLPGEAQRMTITFFDKLVYRSRGRLPLVSAKPETMLVYTRGTREPTPDLALSKATGAEDQAAPAPPAASREESGRGDKGGGRGGQDGEGGGGSAGGAGQEPGSGAQMRAHEPVLSRSEETAPQPTLHITIGSLEIHAAPPARKP